MPNQSRVALASQPLLPKWANAQDGWCRAIAADVLKNGVQASDLDIDRYLKQCLSEKKLSQERWTPKFGQLAKVGSRPRRRSLACHGRDGVILLN